MFTQQTLTEGLLPSRLCCRHWGIGMNKAVKFLLSQGLLSGEGGAVIIDIYSMLAT